MQANTPETEYHFSDFTTAHYRELLQTAKRRWPFYSFEEAQDMQRGIIWRHDVDFSMHRSWRLAQIEQEEGISATYFLHLHSEFYNLLEKEVTGLAKKIAGAGHHIGLHFDTHYYNIENEAELDARLKLEKDLLEDFIEAPVRVFSFHNTSPFTMSCQDWRYAGLINTYASFFKEGFEYCSDSNGYWRFKRLLDVLQHSEASKVQVLTHPEWWQEEQMSPWQRINRSISGRAEAGRKYYADQLRRVGMKNIDWNGPLP